MTEIEIEIQLFGGLRPCFGGDAFLRLAIRPGATTRSLKAELTERLTDPRARELLQTSAVASAMPGSERVLGEDEPLEGLARLALLPPVCGG